MKGGVRVAGSDASVYKMENGNFVVDQSKTYGKYAKREYFGFDAQFGIESGIGLTTLRGEYLWGTQPGLAAKSDSPTGAVTNSIYVRNFSGYYVQLVQDIGRHALTVKYDAYDPNTKVSGNDLKTLGDLQYSALGFGYIYNANANVRIMAYYEAVYNEKVKDGSLGEAYKGNLRDNNFTLRLQYKF